VVEVPEKIYRKASNQKLSNIVKSISGKKFS
jgi:hypothetical protein